ncbi:MAG: hypothetical protein ACLFTK_10810 [Anaerolineales bacterium]
MRRILRFTLLSSGVVVIIMAGILLVARQPKARSPWLAFSTLEGLQWRVCRYLVAADEIICEHELRPTWAPVIDLAWSLPLLAGGGLALLALAVVPWPGRTPRA